MGGDSRIYTDQQNIDFGDRRKCSRDVWSRSVTIRLAKPYDFRTFTIANEPVIVCRGPDNTVRAFLNVCPHRGMLIERRPSGSFLKANRPAIPSA